MIYPGFDREHKRGFTLLELLLVLLIVSLLVAVVPPLFSGAVPGVKLKAAVRDLAAALRLARNQSISHDVETQVSLNLETPAYTIGRQAARALPSGVDLKVAPAARRGTLETSLHVVRFFSDGSSSGTLITLSRGKRSYDLHVGWLTGRVTIIEDTEVNAR